MNNDNNIEEINISKHLQNVLDQLSGVSIFDNKNCINSHQNSKIQGDEGKIDKIPHD